MSFRILAPYIYKSLLISSLSFINFGYSQGMSLQLPGKGVETSAEKPKDVPPVLPPKPLSPYDVMMERITKSASDPVLKSANWGFVVYDPQKNKIVVNYNENSPLVPASTTKILTTETALQELGAGYKWVTQMDYSGEIAADGTLNGELYIIGSGDPSLGTGKAGASGYAALAGQFANAVATAGIKKINGKIVVQTAVFKDYPIAELPKETVWMEYKNYFLPSGNTSNTIPSKEKLLTKFLKFSPGVKRYYYVSPHTDKMVYTEEFPGGNLTATMPGAPEYLAKLVRTELSKKGIAVPNSVETRLVENTGIARTSLFKYSSPSLHEIMTYTNLRSDNAFAEAILKVNGYFIKGSYNLEKGRLAVMEHLKNNGFDTTSLVYVDGSGLSRSHKITPLSQAKYLGKLMKEKYYKDFFETLPTAGESGTLKNMFKSSPAKGRIFAKTGTLNGVKTLAGYIKTYSGKMYTFSVLFNNYKGSVDQAKTKIEQLLEPALEL